MLKKVLMGMLAVVVIGAVVVGVADALTGKSVAAQTAAAQGVAQSTTAQTQAVAGNGQGNGGQGQVQTDTSTQTQGQGRGNGGQGQTTNTTPGIPQANITQTVTIAGVVQSFDGVGIGVTPMTVRRCGCSWAKPLRQRARRGLHRRRSRHGDGLL
jgi:hypothetical protein